MNEHRVVVTGLGVVTPIGVGLEEFWEGLKEGRNGISRLLSSTRLIFALKWRQK